MGVEGGVDEGGFFVGEGFLAGDAIGISCEEFFEDESGDVDTEWGVSGRLGRGGIERLTRICSRCCRDCCSWRLFRKREQWDQLVNQVCVGELELVLRRQGGGDSS